MQDVTDLNWTVESRLLFCSSVQILHGIILEVQACDGAAEIEPLKNTILRGGSESTVTGVSFDFWKRQRNIGKIFF